MIAFSRQVLTISQDRQPLLLILRLNSTHLQIKFLHKSAIVLITVRTSHSFVFNLLNKTLILQKLNDSNKRSLIALPLPHSDKIER